MKTICVIQPYIFPYLPYYQLASAVDEFWIFDDVQYIRRGWMNRNYILNNGQRQLFTLPVSKGSQSDLIRDKQLPESFSDDLVGLRTNVLHAYARAPYLEALSSLLDGLAATRWSSFLDFTEITLRETFGRLRIETIMKRTSELGVSDALRGAQRIIEVCHRAGADRYVNPIGGAALYSREEFAEEGIALKFLEGALATYPQRGVANFEAGLSILDMIAWTSPSDYESQLRNFELK